jgi:DNA-binding response OmpR family regulator
MTGIRFSPRSTASTALRSVDARIADHVPIDTMLIDLLMPELDGLSLRRELRARGNPTSILNLPALDEVGGSGRWARRRSGRRAEAVRSG